MKIGINARYVEGMKEGMHKYVMNLVPNLKKIDNENEYLLFLGRNGSIPQEIAQTGFRCDVPGFSTGSQIQKVLWNHFYLPYAVKKHKLDLFHETSFVAPIFKRCPTVITIHDVAFLYLPFCYTLRTKLYFKALLARSLKMADSVIAISESTKNDILNSFPVSPDKVEVIYQSADWRFRPIADKEVLAKARESYRIERPFIFTVAAGITPRKNLLRLLKAFNLLRTREKINHQLVVVGKKAWSYEDIFEYISVNRLEKDVLFCEDVPQEDLICLYNIADVLAYPSLYEGFGVPPLEAMACECPVVASNVSSIPEVCGDAAVLFNPEDVEGISDAIYKVLSDSSLGEEMVKRGRDQAKKFNGQKTAEGTLALYNRTVR